MRRTARLKTHRLLGLVSLLISGCVTTVITPPVAYKAALEPTTQNHSELKTRALGKKSRVNAASGKLQSTAKVPSGHGDKWGSARVGSWYINKEHDPATKWSYHGARWMAPQLARWLTPDPSVKLPLKVNLFKPWHFHPYQYVNQNPILFWDPDGLIGGNMPSGTSERILQSGTATVTGNRNAVEVEQHTQEVKAEMVEQSAPVAVAAGAVGTVGMFFTPVGQAMAVAGIVGLGVPVIIVYSQAALDSSPRSQEVLAYRQQALGDAANAYLGTTAAVTAIEGVSLMGAPKNYSTFHLGNHSPNGAARQMADSLRGLPKKQRPTNASAYRPPDGKVVTQSHSAKGNVQRTHTSSVQRDLDSVPVGQRSAHHGECGEMGCLSNFERATGTVAQDGAMSSVNVRGANSTTKTHGTNQAPCSSCSYVLQKRNISYSE